MGIICCLYSSACLLKFLLGVIDFGNSEVLNIILGEGAGVGQGDAHEGVGGQRRAAGDGYDGGGAETTDNAVLAFEFVPSCVEGAWVAREVT